MSHYLKWAGIVFSVGIAAILSYVGFIAPTPANVNTLLDVTQWGLLVMLSAVIVVLIGFGIIEALRLIHRHAEEYFGTNTVTALGFWFGLCLLGAFGFGELFDSWIPVMLAPVIYLGVPLLLLRHHIHEEWREAHRPPSNRERNVIDFPQH